MVVGISEHMTIIVVGRFLSIHILDSSNLYLHNLEVDQIHITQDLIITITQLAFALRLKIAISTLKITMVNL